MPRKRHNPETPAETLTRVRGDLKANPIERKPRPELKLPTTKEFLRVHTAAEVKKIAGDVLFSPKGTKEILVRAVGDRLDVLHAEAIQEDEIRSARPEVPAKPVEGPTAKSNRKAGAFAAKVEALGWTIEDRYPEEGTTEILATRGGEAIFIAWKDGRMVDNPMPTYTIAHRTILMRNASQAVQFAARPPEEAEKELARVAANKSFKRKAPEDGPRRFLPFEPESATDAEILSAVIGARVSWHNPLTESEETVWVSNQRKFLSIRIAPDGERVVWCVADSGFRAFRVSALTRVEDHIRS